MVSPTLPHEGFTWGKGALHHGWMAACAKGGFNGAIYIEGYSAVAAEVRLGLRSGVQEDACDMSDRLRPRKAAGTAIYIPRELQPRGAEGDTRSYA